MATFVGFPGFFRLCEAPPCGSLASATTVDCRQRYNVAAGCPRSSYIDPLSSVSDHKPALLDWGWPWIFEQPGRLSSELPGEEAFTGFGGLELFLDDFEVDRVDVDGMGDEYHKVCREVRNACHCQVSIDYTPDVELVVLSETGATLIGIPRDAVRMTRYGRQGRQYFQPAESTSASGISWSKVQQEELSRHLTGTRLAKGSHPLGCCYGGHQFGHWAGQLGDGRVATLGELRAVGDRDKLTGIASTWCGCLVEVQLKGIGKTPFSRGGDGKAVLSSCLREYLFSEAFLGLGLGTAVAVAVCSTAENAVARVASGDRGDRGDIDNSDRSGALQRSPRAVLCRTAPSFLRFGSLELPARRGELDVVRCLADFCLRHLSSHLKTDEKETESVLSLSEERLITILPVRRADKTIAQGPSYSKTAGTGPEQSFAKRNNRDVWEPSESPESPESESQSCTAEAGSGSAYLELLVDVIKATARMIASWQALGFCHGVLNTDNLTLLGIALDFGPCGFMERYDPSWCPNEGDSALRYTFQKQPDAAAWNCERLAEAFSSLIGVSGIAEANKVFSPAFDAAYGQNLQRKLGLTGMGLGRGWVDLLRRTDADGSETTENVSSDARFVLELFRLMSCCGTDFTRTWRSLIDVPALSEALGARGGSVGILAQIQRDDVVSTQDQVDSVASSGALRDRIIAEADGKDKRDRTVAGVSAQRYVEGLELSDEEVLRPVIGVLTAARVSREHLHHWAAWTLEYMTRIDSQGIGRLHPGGAEAGRRERLDTMRKSNPSFVLRAEVLEKALKVAKEGDMMLVHELEEKLSSPYASGSDY